MTADNMTAAGHGRVLADGNEIPLLGLGVWQVPDGPECEQAVRWALECGYRHIDTAQAYGNERSVGRALHASGVPREEVFITTKFYPGSSDAEHEARRSLASTRSTCTSCTGRRAGGREPGTACSVRTRAAMRARSASRTTASPSWMTCSPSPMCGPSSTRCSSARSNTAARCWKPVWSAGWRSRPTARWAPVGTSATAA
jgi:Aldo/keto reductase family